MTEEREDKIESADAPLKTGAAGRMVQMRAVIIAGVVAAAVGLFIGLGLGNDEPPPASAHEHAAEAQVSMYTCSMHPQIRSEEPGQCPICGMDLVPVTDVNEGEQSPVRVELSERSKTLARIRTVKVARLGDASAQIRLAGRIEQDETRVRTVTAWTAGRIDRLHVATTGETVRPGQTIATIYSPEIYTGHRDLLQAARQLRTLSGGMEFARSSAEATLEAARQKLRLLGVSNQEIASMEQADEPWTQVRIRTRFGGTVIQRLVDEGAYVQAGTGIYRVADLSRLWVQLDAYESDLPRLRLGQHVELSIEAVPGETFDGTIAFIDPVVDRVKRTARVRVEVTNEGVLRPGMFVEARVAGSRPVGEAAPLVIPATAPLFSGRRSIVYVEVPNAPRPTYEAREVVLGTKAGDVYPVVSGLETGERVVVNGAFAIDADLQIRGGDSLMARADDDTRGREDRLDAPPEFRSSLDPIVRAYLEMQTALAADDLATAQQAGSRLGEAADVFSPDAPGLASEVWLGLRSELTRLAKELDQAADLAAGRHVFRSFSRVISKLLARFGNPTNLDLRVAYCPMAFENEGAEWIQATDQLDNSYFGASMLSCGEIRETIPAEGAPDGGRP